MPPKKDKVNGKNKIKKWSWMLFIYHLLNKLVEIKTIEF